jgi:outer membrane protein OmpA-like peptidoglycan-associated protein
MRILNRSLFTVIVWFAALLARPSLAQTALPAQSDRAGEIMALTYPEGKTVSVKFQGTTRLPEAKGEAKVERKKGTTEIEIELDEMRPAILFGGDFNTYVFWTVSPEGYVNNVGEFVLDGNRGKLNVTTRLETFGMVVTAEPHFLVQSPSRFVVLENSSKEKLDASIQTSQIRYQAQQSEYKFQRESLPKNLEATSEMRSDVSQAKKAVELAERSQAEKYSLVKLTEARLLLRKTEEAVRGRLDKKEITNLGKETVRLAYQAQTEAEQAQADERKRAQEAEQQRLTAEAAEASRRAAEEAAKRQEDARRAEEAARRAAAEVEARTEAAQRAQAAAARATQEREEARKRMQEALGRIAETRDSARGLIVNLPDILFDTAKSTLQPQAREVISRIAGVLMVQPGLSLKIEGHTDSQGSDEYNMTLSQHRAESVKEYLTQAGVKQEIITTQGLGETTPVADNSTADGRQKNRRVEIIIDDSALANR